MEKNKFVKTPIRLSQEAGYVLFNLSAQTHPNVKFREWVENDKRNIDSAIQELLDLKLIQNINGIYSPTVAGVNYFKQKPENNLTVDELLRKLDRAIPKNKSFRQMAEDLTDTAVVASIYELLFEMGKRTNPDDPESVLYWQEKINAIAKVLLKATPDTLYQRGVKQREKF